MRAQVWKNAGTGELALEVHPCGVLELFVDPLPDGAKREGALYPDGAHITDLKTVREIVYKIQRPAIAPQVRLEARAYAPLIDPHSLYIPMTGTLLAISSSKYH